MSACPRNSRPHGAPVVGKPPISKNRPSGGPRRPGRKPGPVYGAARPATDSRAHRRDSRRPAARCVSDVRGPRRGTAVATQVACRAGIRCRPPMRSARRRLKWARERWRRPLCCTSSTACRSARSPASINTLRPDSHGGRVGAGAAPRRAPGDADRCGVGGQCRR